MSLFPNLFQMKQHGTGSRCLLKLRFLANNPKIDMGEVRKDTLKI
jgi:hypothetical protein